MGFDAATEVALLTAVALAAGEHIPWEAILALPILFTAGMSLMDTSDGLFMNVAYGWAFFNPVRKVYYNLAITGLSVAICVLIGGIETLSLVPLEVHGVSQHAGFWGATPTSKSDGRPACRFRKRPLPEATDRGHHHA